MEWWQSLILGLVEGVTEYLPVSSTGHLLVTQRFLGLESNETNDAFAICIQAGAIVAVLGLYARRVRDMALGVLGKNPVGLKLSLAVLTAFMPAAIIGLLLQDWIKLYLFGGEKWGLWPIVAAWFVGGVAILAVDAYRKKRRSETGTGLDLESLTIRMALIIGFIQCIAMWPGVSRSLVTIVGGVLVGLNLRSAVEFSFLLGVLTLGATTAYDGFKHGAQMLEAFGPGVLAIGFLAAWVSAVLSVKWMVSYLNKHGLGIFGWYRIALAITIAVLIIQGYFATTGTPT